MTGESSLRAKAPAKPGSPGTAAESAAHRRRPVSPVRQPGTRRSSRSMSSPSRESLKSRPGTGKMPKNMWQGNMKEPTAAEMLDANGPATKAYKSLVQSQKNEKHEEKPFGVASWYTDMSTDSGIYINGKIIIQTTEEGIEIQDKNTIESQGGTNCRVEPLEGVSVEVAHEVLKRMCFQMDHRPVKIKKAERKAEKLGSDEIKQAEREAEKLGSEAELARNFHRAAEIKVSEAKGRLFPSKKKINVKEAEAEKRAAEAEEAEAAHERALEVLRSLRQKSGIYRKEKPKIQHAEPHHFTREFVNRARTRVNADWRQHIVVLSEYTRITVRLGHWQREKAERMTKLKTIQQEALNAREMTVKLFHDV